jgi:hypothetical protein
VTCTPTDVFQLLEATSALRMAARQSSWDSTNAKAHTAVTPFLCFVALFLLFNAHHPLALFLLFNEPHHPLALFL